MSKERWCLALAGVMGVSLMLWADDKKTPNVEAYAQQVQKLAASLPQAFDKAVKEHGGVVTSASLELNEDGDDTIPLVYVEIVKPPKDGKPASMWSLSFDAETGELMSMENITRQKERELAEREKDRQQRRLEEEKERKKEQEEREKEKKEQ